MTQPKKRSVYYRHLLSRLPGGNSKERLLYLIGLYPDGAGAINTPEYRTKVLTCRDRMFNGMTLQTAGIKVNYCPWCLGHVDEPPVRLCRFASNHREPEPTKSEKDRAILSAQKELLPLHPVSTEVGKRYKTKRKVRTEQQKKSYADYIERTVGTAVVYDE